MAILMCGLVLCAGIVDMHNQAADASTYNMPIYYGRVVSPLEQAQDPWVNISGIEAVPISVPAISARVPIQIQ